MTREDLKLLRRKGLTNYVRMGKELPPQELVKAYQCSVKIFCQNAKGEDSTYNSVGEKISHPSHSYTRKGSRIIITFKRETQDFITGGVYNAMDYKNYQDTKVLGGFFKK